MMWEFWCYVSESGRNQIQEWYDGQSETVQAEFDTAVAYLEAQPFSGWRRPKAAKLKGNPCGHFHEIRFRAERVQYRPLGYFGPRPQRFTLVFCATEKDDDFVPKNACQQALDRKKKVDSAPDIYSCCCSGEETVGFACCKASESRLSASGRARESLPGNRSPNPRQ